MHDIDDSNQHNPIKSHALLRKYFPDKSKMFHLNMVTN